MTEKPMTARGWLKLKTGESFDVTVRKGYQPDYDSFTGKTVHFFRLRGWSLKPRFVNVQGDNVAYVVTEGL